MVFLELVRGGLVLMALLVDHIHIAEPKMTIHHPDLQSYHASEDASSSYLYLFILFHFYAYHSWPSSILDIFTCYISFLVTSPTGFKCKRVVKLSFAYMRVISPQCSIYARIHLGLH